MKVSGIYSYAGAFKYCGSQTPFLFPSCQLHLYTVLNYNSVYNVRPRFSTVNQTVDALHSQEIVHRIEKEIHMKF